MTPDDPRPPEPHPQVPDEFGAPADAPDTSAGPGAAPADPTTEAGADAPTSGRATPADPTTGTTPVAPASGPDTRVDPTPDGTTPTDPTTEAGPDAPTAGLRGADVDELASALVDGLAGPDEAASHPPEVVARAAELAAARAALRDVPAIDPEARERGLAAALAAFDEEAATSASPDRPPPPVAGTGRATAAPPVDLASHRRSRGDHIGERGARQGLPRWFGAAAAAVVVLAGLVGLAALSSSGGDDEANTAMDSGAGQSQESSDDGAAATAEDGDEAAPGAAEDATGTESSAVDAGDLGMFATGDALVDRLRESLAGVDVLAELEPEASAPRNTDRTTSAFAACDGAPPPPLGDTDATPVLHGRAVIGDEAVDVWVMDTSQGRRIVAIDGACELVLDRPAR